MTRNPTIDYKMLLVERQNSTFDQNPNTNENKVYVATKNQILLQKNLMKPTFTIRSKLKLLLLKYRMLLFS